MSTPTIITNTPDMSAFRLDTLVDPAMIATPLLTTIPVRKPGKQQFIRVSPDEAYQFDAALLEFDRETYLVAPTMMDVLSDEYRICRLVLGVARGASSPFLWPLKLPREDGMSNPWNDSAMQAAEAAKSAWVRVMSDIQQGMYVTKTAEGITDEPIWPEEPMDDLMEIAFRGRLIMSDDHTVVRKLRGLQ